MPRAKLPPAERRAGIVAAARRLIATKGFAHTSVSDIVAEAGVAQGTFYWYFSSKGDVLDAIAADVVSATTDAIVQVAQDRASDALTKFERIREIFADYLVRQREFIEHFHDERNCQLHFRLNQEAARRTVPVLDLVIRQGVEEGVFATDYPAEAAGFVFSATQAITEYRAFGLPESLTDRMEALWDFVLKGLGCMKGAAASTSER